MEAMNFNDDKPAGWGRLADFLNSAPKYEKMAQTIEKMKKMKQEFGGNPRKTKEKFLAA